jgi:chromosome segregation ATPase
LSGTLEIEAAHRQKMKDYEQRQKDYEQRQKDYEQRKREDEQRLKDYEQRKREDEQEIAKLNAMILQTRNEKKQIENEIRQIESDIERLAVLESKIDSSFSKYGINLPLGQTPKQP